MASETQIIVGKEPVIGAAHEKSDALELHRCLRDVVALSTLPVIWSGAAPPRIAEVLAASLFTTLSPEFIYVSVAGAPGGLPIEVAQTVRNGTDPRLASTVGPAIAEWARSRDPEDLLCLPPWEGYPSLRVTTRSIGLNGEFGVIGAAFAEGHTLSPLHHLVLNVAATQAQTAIRNSQLVRTVRESEERFRTLVSNITHVPWTRDAAGRFAVPQPAWEAYTGQSWHEHQGFGWLNAIHPEDRERIVEIWHRACSSHTRYEAEGRLWHALTSEWRHFRAKAAPLMNPEGGVREWVGTCTDVENEKRAEVSMRESEARFRQMFDALPAAVYTTDASGRVTYFNPAAVEFSGRTPVLYSDEWCVSWKLYYPDGSPMPHSECPMAISLREGRRIRGTEAIAERPDGRRLWFAPYPTPFFDSEGRVIGGINMLVDITERKAAERALQESEARFRNMADHAPFMIWVTEQDGSCSFLSNSWYAFTGQTKETGLGSGWIDAIHPDEKAAVCKAFQTAHEKRVDFKMEGRLRRYDGEYRWAFVAAVPRSSDEGQFLGHIGSVIDITERKQSEQALREKARLDGFSARISMHLAESGNMADMLRHCTQTMVDDLDAAFARIWLLNEEENVLELRASSGLYTNLDGGHSRIPVGSFKIGVIAAERRPHLTNQVVGDPRVPEQEWAKREGMVAFGGYPLIIGQRLVGVMAMFSRHALPDLTLQAMSRVANHIALGIDRKRAEEERATMLRTAELLNRIGPAINGELDTKRLTQTITDIATQLTGAQFGALFHNMVNEDGERYMLYTLSGASPEDFAHFPLPRKTEVFGPTFRGEHVVRSADITQDPRYGRNAPHRGMPKGHLPVRSYLAAPVILRDGTVLGGLFFAHEQTGVFREEHERIVRGIAAQAAIALDNARLFTETRDKQRELSRSNAELRRANADLEQFAYSASHDLQEPIRNVAVYGEILERRYNEVLDARGKEFLGFMTTAARRMEALVKDLLNYTKSGAADDLPEDVDAGVALTKALANLSGAIQETHATVTTGVLPIVRIPEVQLQQLFQNFISNAIKYRRDTEAPRIHVSAERDGNDWRFAVRDNGIGISPEYHERIFGIFKRLHTEEKYSGTGIGLAICQKIVERNGGRIWVESSGEGKGSTFCWTLPAGEER